MTEKPDLDRRLTKLEERVKIIEKFLVDTNENFELIHFETVVRPVSSIPSKQGSANDEIVRSAPSPMDDFINWCKTDWLMKLGAFLLLLALGWFVTYAFVNNWIGPIGRITLGILAGAGIMIAGSQVISKKRAAGQVLVVLGGVMVLLTIFAARIAYDFFTPAVALAMMSVVVVGMAAISVVHNAKSVAILALMGGAIVPMLVRSPHPDFFGLLCYIFVLNSGTILVAALRGWREMISIALIVTGLFAIFAFPELEKSMGVHSVWIFMALYFGLFFFANIAAIIKTRLASKADLFTTAINGLLLLFWVNEFVPRESASLVLSGIILLLVGISYVLVKMRGLKNMLYIHVGLAILFLGAATAFELKGETQTIAFSIEALVIVALAAYALKNSRLAQIVSATQLLPIVMAVPSIMARSWFKESLLNKDFFVLLITILSLAGTTAILKHKETAEQKMPLAFFHGFVAALFAVALVWLSSHNIFDSVNSARGVALVIYSIVGVGSLFYGTYFQKKTQRVVGGILLAGVVLRLLFVEVWSMSLTGRIITFVAIGVLLVSTAFFQKRISHPNH